MRATSTHLSMPLKRASQLLLKLKDKLLFIEMFIMPGETAFLKALHSKRPCARCEHGGRSKGCESDFDCTVLYFNIRVGADIDVIYSPLLNKMFENFRSPEPFFKRVLEKTKLKLTNL